MEMAPWKRRDGGEERDTLLASLAKPVRSSSEGTP